MIRKLRVTVDGKPFDVTVELLDETGNSSLTLPPPITASPPTREEPSAPPPPPRPQASPGDVVSPLSGRVTAINAQIGQTVAEGDHLLTLEAMKMNTFVFSPRLGKIAEIRVSIGAAVEEGQALIRME